MNQSSIFFKVPSIYPQYPIDFKQSVKMVASKTIQYTNRQQQQIRLNQSKAAFLQKFENSAAIAKQAYRQITQDQPKYKFGKSNLSYDQQEKERQKLKVNEEKNVKKQKEKIAAKYDFRKITEVNYFKDKGQLQLANKKKLRIRQIELMEEDQFQKQFPQYQFYTEYKQLSTLKQILNERLLEFDRQMYLTFTKQTFKVQRIEDNILLGRFSKFAIIPYQDHLTLNHKILMKQYRPLQMPKQHNNINVIQMLKLCAGTYTTKQIKKQIQQLQKIKLNENIRAEENLIQKKYNDMKSKINDLRELKKNKKTMQLKHTGVQMQKIIVDQSLNQLIEIDTQRTLLKIKDLEKIRKNMDDEQIASNQQKDIFLNELNIELRGDLFNLLLIIVKNQKFINFTEYLKGQDKYDVQDKILQKVYFHLSQIKNKQTKSHQKKIQLLNFYLNHRKIIKQYFQKSNLIFNNNTSQYYFDDKKSIHKPLQTSNIKKSIDNQSTIKKSKTPTKTPTKNISKSPFKPAGKFNNTIRKL